MWNQLPFEVLQTFERRHVRRAQHADRRNKIAQVTVSSRSVRHPPEFVCLVELARDNPCIELNVTLQIMPFGDNGPPGSAEFRAAGDTVRTTPGLQQLAIPKAAVDVGIGIAASSRYGSNTMSLLRSLPLQRRGQTGPVCRARILQQYIPENPAPMTTASKWEMVGDIFLPIAVLT